MYVLQLHDMRSPEPEERSPVARAETIDRLKDYVDSQRVVMYEDEARDLNGYKWMRTYHKVFRKGGPLEWYQPPEQTCGFDPYLRVDSLEDHLKKSAEWYNSNILTIRPLD